MPGILYLLLAAGVHGSGMAVPRGLVVNPAETGWYHCVSRCVRRAFLCGQGASSGGVDYSYRRQWIRDRLRYLTGVFAVDVAGYAVMSNHLHVVVRVRPQGPDQWSPQEVASRWAHLYPSAYHADGSPKPPDPLRIQQLAADQDFVARVRARLGSLSWFMRALKEPIARRANKEDRCTGAFWEGRFSAVALLDEAAIVTCMAYVDLNPIRAGLAQTLETSEFTSVDERIEAESALPSTPPAPTSAPASTTVTLASRPGVDGRRQHESRWLIPLSQCATAIDEAWYLRLLDRSGRLARGVMAPDLPPLLDRLGLDQQRWARTLRGRRQMQGSALGHAGSRVREALRRGRQWLSCRCAAFVGSRLKPLTPD